MLKNKKIILGITGSIATYKVPTIIRDFQKAGAEVKVVATAASLKFVSQLVLENLIHSSVIHNLFDDKLQQQGAWHIELAH
jgi:phosphopantothenoylcysteine decarboxylase/phosphopantothenate--cysteine ligase